MIIIGCDGADCQRRSPDGEGRMVAHGWVNMVLQRQRDRSANNGKVHLTFCEDCWGKVELPTPTPAVETV